MKEILVIDDEKSILDLLSVVFTKEGYSVKTALSAVKAFELIEKENFSLIITDIKLPEKSGLDILKFVKEKKPEKMSRKRMVHILKKMAISTQCHSKQIVQVSRCRGRKTFQ